MNALLGEINLRAPAGPFGVQRPDGCRGCARGAHAHTRSGMAGLMPARREARTARFVPAGPKAVMNARQHAAAAGPGLRHRPVKANSELRI